MKNFFNGIYSCILVMLILMITVTGCKDTPNGSEDHNNGQENSGEGNDSQENDSMKYAKDEIASYSGESVLLTKNINQVDFMPDRPDNYKYLDYKEIAVKQDELLFSFAKNSQYQPTEWRGENPSYAPLGYWVDGINNDVFSGRAFGLPSYIGHVNQTGGGTIALDRCGSPEGITVLSAVWGATLCGIDKSKQTFTDASGETVSYDFVNMLKAFYNREGFILNNIGGSTGGSFWYELYPQILYARIYNLYKSDDQAKKMILDGADQWVDALPYFEDTGLGRFAYTSLNFTTKRTILTTRVEVPNTGVVFLLLNAYRLTNDNKYMEAAYEYADYCEAEMKNTYYELLCDYMGYNTAYMNFMQGTNYTVSKFVNNIFDSEDDYRPSGVVNDKWGEYDAYGLMAFDNYSHKDDTAYAFFMNTVHPASTLAPMLRYDQRFADDVGKWFLQMSNSCRLFYRDELSPDCQSSYNLAKAADPEGVIAYEGVRKYPRYHELGVSGQISPYATGDPRIYGWGQTDYGIYMSAHVGILGGIIEKTDVEQILRIDITKCDDFKQEGDFQQYLFYNPYEEEKTVSLELGDTSYALFDTVRKKIIHPEAKGTAAISIPAKSSVIVCMIPAGTKFEIKDNYFIVGGIRLVQLGQCAVNITSHTVPKSEFSAQAPTEITLDIQTQDNDSVQEMTVSFNGKILYTGAAASTFLFNPEEVKENWLFVPGSHGEGGRNWDKNPVEFINQFYEGELKVELKTQKGAYDSTVLRIRRK